MLLKRSSWLKWRTHWSLLVGTWGLLLIVRFGLWRVPFQQLLSYLQRLSDAIAARQPLFLPRMVSVSQIADAVEISTRFMPGSAKCLARALTTHVLMRRYGYAGTLQIGVSKATDGRLEAHAWVMYQDQIPIGRLPSLDRFIPITTFENPLL
jgi:Transglutaminase-like superfamily